MFGKRRCYLCGGKLDNGRCVLCGLDNTKIEKKNYRLNESSFDRKKKMRSQYSSETRTEQKRAEQKRAEQNIYRPPASSYPVKTKTGKAKKSAGGNTNTNGKGRAALLITVVAAAAGLAGPVINLVQEFIADYSSGGYTESWSDETVEYDLYSYVTRELSDTGEVYETELGGGEYIVGVHIPEGSYRLELLEGMGGVSVTDPVNSIYTYEFFTEEGDEYDDELTVLDDVRLYSGALVKVDSYVKMNFYTETGQTQEMVYEENPLTETVSLERDQTHTAGTDFPAGVYDISSVESGEIDFSVYLGELSEEYPEVNYRTEYIWSEGEEKGTVFHNAVLPEGAEITSPVDITLTPSPVIENEDYDGYYDRYR